jgi:hypothetical protein
MQPSWSMTTVYDSPDGVEPDAWDAGGKAIDPYEFDYSPLGWLVKRLDDTAYHVEVETINGDADQGVTVYASQGREYGMDGTEVRVCAHVYGYTVAQVERAARLCNDYPARVAAAREYAITTTLMRAMLREPVEV